MKNIVSREWLINNMSNENLVILDVRGELGEPEYGLKEYEKGHINGAQFVSVEEVLTGKIEKHGGRHPLPEMKEFVEDMKKIGVSNASIVVIYDDGDLAMAGRLWWMLKYIGKENVYVLEGGIKAWINNNLEVTKEVLQPKESKDLSLNINHEIEVHMNYVKDNLHKDNIVIIDSRAYERYIGEVEPLDRIPGHIPSALNYPWMNLVKDGKVMSKDESVKYFENLQQYDEIIVHCGSGITGTVNIMFMEEIGLKPKLYLGGYSDWISYDDNIVIQKP